MHSLGISSVARSTENRKNPLKETAGMVGVDFNAMGDLAVMADPQSGHVRAYWRKWRRTERALAGLY